MAGTLHPLPGDVPSLPGLSLGRGQVLMSLAAQLGARDTHVLLKRWEKLKISKSVKLQGTTKNQTGKIPQNSTEIHKLD